MRERLGEMRAVRGTFTAAFERLGQKAGYRGPIQQTVLLRDVRDAGGRRVADHLWFNLTKGFAALQPLVAGERLQFDARVKAYRKGYMGYRIDDAPSPAIDYKLAWPTRIVRVTSWCSVEPTAEELRQEDLRRQREDLQFKLETAEWSLQHVRGTLADRLARGVPDGSKKQMALEARVPQLLDCISSLRAQLDALNAG